MNLLEQFQEKLDRDISIIEMERENFDFKTLFDTFPEAIIFEEFRGKYSIEINDEIYKLDIYNYKFLEFTKFCRMHLHISNSIYWQKEMGHPPHSDVRYKLLEDIQENIEEFVEVYWPDMEENPYKGLQWDEKNVEPPFISSEEFNFLND